MIGTRRVSSRQMRLAQLVLEASLAMTLTTNEAKPPRSASATIKRSKRNDSGKNS